MAIKAPAKEHWAHEWTPAHVKEILNLADGMKDEDPWIDDLEAWFAAEEEFLNSPECDDLRIN